MNYPKMRKADVDKLMAEGRLHLEFMIKIYRKQVEAGRYFLHEHPATAVSWHEKSVLNMALLPGVQIVTADQCMYGLTTKSENGGEDPAKKPTKFMTNAGPLADLLRVRCDKSHVHQALVSGRCANAAFYPLKLIRTFLKGMRATMDEVKLEKQFGLVGPPGSNANREPDGPNFARSDEGKAALVVEGRTRSQIANQVEVVLDAEEGIFSIADEKKEVPWVSRCKRTNGGHVDVAYDLRNFKDVYRDEYTNEVLPHALVVEAIREELNYFNNTVWHVAEPSDTRKLKDSKTVRSRWVLCNKGDAACPDVRARLVACEVNTSGTKDASFFASTPPLEAKRMLFCKYADKPVVNGERMRLSFIDIKKAYFNGIPKRNILMKLSR